MRIGSVTAVLAALWLAAAPAPAGEAAAAPPPAPPAGGPAGAARPGAAAARPALWVLEDRDTRVVLLGTTHSFERGFRWRSRRLEQAIAEADELVVEVAEDQ